MDIALSHLLWEDGWGLSILRGSAVTLAVGVLGMSFGLLLGLLLAAVKWARIPVVSQIADVYTVIVRSVPGLLVVYLIFFGSVEFIARVGAFFGYTDAFQSAYSFIVGVLSVGAIAAAYAAEVFRGALNAIHPGQIEAAHAVGMQTRKLYTRIIGPQMFRYALPGISNVWQSTIKDTSLVSVTGLAELIRVAYIGAGTTRQPLIFFVIAAVVFFVITLFSQVAFGLVERNLNRGVRAV
jgi:octopine/nopaline transport system permease protein